MADYRLCDWQNPEDCRAFLKLLQQYMSDPMGEADPLTEAQEQKLIKDLSVLPQARLFFVCDDDIPAGYLLAFQGYTTFGVGPSYNIHDFFVSKDYRGKGFGLGMMEYFIQWALSENVKKLTLEVRDDNHHAQKLYKKAGFAPTDPEMLFYTKML